MPLFRIIEVKVIWKLRMLGGVIIVKALNMFMKENVEERSLDYTFPKIS